MDNIGSHQSTRSIQTIITGTPPHLTCRATRTSQTINIQTVPAHGKERHSMKAFSIIGKTMWNDLLTDERRECTSVDMFKEAVLLLEMHIDTNDAEFAIVFINSRSILYTHIATCIYKGNVQTLSLHTMFCEIHIVLVRI